MWNALFNKQPTDPTLRIAVELGFMCDSCVEKVGPQLKELKGREPALEWLIEHKYLSTAQADRVESILQKRFPSEYAIQATKRARAAMVRGSSAITRISDITETFSLADIKAAQKG